jgi:hypothetical protein
VLADRVASDDLGEDVGARHAIGAVVHDLYGDDIDLATPMGDDIEVVAWATVEGAKSKCEKRPAVTAFTPKAK